MTSARPAALASLAGAVAIAIVGPRVGVVPTLLLMLAAGVIVPLGVDVAVAEASPPVWTLLLLFSALGGVLGWVFPPGSVWAIAFASVHVITCFAIGLAGLARIIRRPPLPDLAIALGMVFFPVGGTWLMAARGGVPLIGFHEPVVTFTAAHFHFAGFAAPLVIGGAGKRVFEGRPPTRHYRIAAIAVCSGIPLTAIGIATSPIIEKLAACSLALGMLAAAFFLVTAARRRAPTEIGALLFGISGATLLVTMSLAATFAVTSSAGRESTFAGTVSLQTMIDFHGAANAVGFALAGLPALTLTPRAPQGC